MSEQQEGKPHLFTYDTNAFRRWAPSGLLDLNRRAVLPRASKRAIALPTPTPSPGPSAQGPEPVTEPIPAPQPADSRQPPPARALMPEPPTLEPLIMLKTMGPVVLDLPPEPPRSFWKTKRFWLVTLALMCGLSLLPLLGVFATQLAPEIEVVDLIPAAQLMRATPMPTLSSSTTTPSTNTSTEPVADPKHSEVDGVKLQISTVSVERPIRATVKRTRRRRGPRRRHRRKRRVDVDAILQVGAR